LVMLDERQKMIALVIGAYQKRQLTLVVRHTSFEG